MSKIIELKRIKKTKWENGYTPNEIKIIAIKKKLRRLEPFYVVDCEYESDIEQENFYVIFRDRKKIKYGVLRNPYWNRYGINTVSTYAGKGNSWNISVDDIDSVFYNNMVELFNTGECDLPILNIDKLMILD